MKHRVTALMILALAVGATSFALKQPPATATALAAAQPASSLWPETTPYRTGYLKVSPIHDIYYQVGGNPKGTPVMVLHGGPGAGCTPADFRYFNPERFHIVLHDQRGSGLSKPLGELRENTTQALVEDVEKLRVHLGLGKVILFGGSWGSTLALAYAETHPQHVSGIVLRGVFTATRDEIDHYYHGGAARFFPEAHAALLQCIDRPAEHDYASQLLTKLQSGDAAVRTRCALAWARYEAKIAFLEIDDRTLDGALAHPCIGIGHRESVHPVDRSHREAPCRITGIPSLRRLATGPSSVLSSRRGKVAATGGYFGARQLLAEVEARFRVPAGGGRSTDPRWTERRLVPLAGRTLARLKEIAAKARRDGFDIGPMQVAALLLEKTTEQVGAEDVEAMVRPGRRANRSASAHSLKARRPAESADEP